MRGTDADGGGRGTASPERVRGIEDLLLVLTCLNVLFLAWRIYSYGVATFYAGQPLVDLHSTYGQASVSGGVLQIITFVLRFTALGAVILYVHTSLRNGFRIRYRYPVFILVIIPILSLARSDALIGAWLLLAVYGVERRIMARHGGVRQGSDAAPGRISRRGSPRALVVSMTLIVAIAAGLVIGGIRHTRLAPELATSPLERGSPLLKSELTPIQAYSEIKQHEATLGHTRGSTIVWPLLLKVVPRAFVPGKPINSGAYYMSVVRPGEFAANFALPPTFFGDAYLNFGMPGALLACFLLGFVVARVDFPYREARLTRLPWFLIVFANFYAILRAPLSESLAAVLLTSAVWLMLRPFGNMGRERASAKRERVPLGTSEDDRRVVGAV